MKFIFVSSFLFFTVVCGNDEDLRRIDAIRPERGCASAGGMCTIAKDCPDGQLTNEMGLCPKQQSRGIECCNGLSTKETRCRKLGGTCMPISTNCNPRLVIERASDCSPKMKCCVLV